MRGSTLCGSGHWAGLSSLIWRRGSKDAFVLGIEVCFFESEPYPLGIV